MRVPCLLAALWLAEPDGGHPLPPVDFAPVRAGACTIELPRDHGAHPEFRTEWWYVTGWLRRSRMASRCRWVSR